MIKVYLELLMLTSKALLVGLVGIGVFFQIAVKVGYATALKATSSFVERLPLGIAQLNLAEITTRIGLKNRHLLAQLLLVTINIIVLYLLLKIILFA